MLRTNCELGAGKLMSSLAANKPGGGENVVGFGGRPVRK